MAIRLHLGLLSAVLPALLGAGCTGGPALPKLTSSLGADPLPLGPNEDPPVDVYARVARGALKCWFGPEGSLKATHVFHGKADPSSAGGAAEIGVQTREAGSDHGVLRAFAVLIKPLGEGSAIEVQNVRFSEADAVLMKADVVRWVAGEEGCSVVGTGGWGAGPKPPPSEPTKDSVVSKGEERPLTKR